MGKFKHYLIVAWRSLKKHKVSSALSMLGLVAAFSLSIIVGLMTWNAMSSDSHWKNADNIYQLSRSKMGDDGRMGLYGIPRGLAGDLKDFSSDIIFSSSPYFLNFDVKIDNKYQGLRGKKVDRDFLAIFDYDLVSGDMASVMDTPGGMALSASKAKEFFGDENPIGKSLETFKNDELTLYTILAIYNVPPKNSSFSNYSALVAVPEDVSRQFAPWIYLLQKDNADLDYLLERITKHVAEKYPPKAWGKGSHFQIDNLKGSTFHGVFSSYYRERQIGLILSAALMLLVALINYMAIITAVSSTRGKDIAMRKILGAKKIELSLQYIVEAICLISFSYILAIGVAVIIAGQIGAIVGSTFVVISAETARFLLVGWLAALIAGLASATYPIWAMVNGKAAKILANVQSSIASGGTRLRSILLLMQSAFGLGLVLGAGLIYLQTNLLEFGDKGFEPDGLLHIQIPRNQKDMLSAKPLLNAIKRINDVKNASLSRSYTPFISGSGSNRIAHPSTGEPILVKTAWIGDNFLEVLHVPILAGRVPPSQEQVAQGGEQPSEKAVVVNRLFVDEILGLEKMEQALGRCLFSITSEDKKSDTCLKVVAVADNYQNGAEEDSLSPTLFELLSTSYGASLALRYETGDEKIFLKDLENAWNEYFPLRPFKYSFIDDQIEIKFRPQRANASLLLFTALSSLILTIAGLYAMAKFVVARRGREIAIRRVLGASSFDIVRLVVTQLAKPIILGAFIGLPVGWYYAMDWLTAYTVRIEPEPWHAVLLGVVGVIFFILTAASEILRAVRIRPAEALHHE